MEVLQLLASPLTEICKCAIAPLKRQIGYVVHYKKNVKKLKIKVEDLGNTRAELQQKVDAARRNLESIRRVVELWIERADMETIEDETIVKLMNGESIEMINHQCFKGWCSCLTYHSVGRKAEKKLFIIDELLNEGKSFGDVVSDPSIPFGTVNFLPTIDDFEVFTSREYGTNQVMETLNDEETFFFGVYGMGGVGKTMLMNQVSKRVVDENLFDAVVMSTVSQDVDLKRIQGEFAEKLGLKSLQDVDDISTRSRMLFARLNQEKKILVILDDLWSAMNLSLSDIGIPYGENHHHKGCKVVITTRSLDVCSSMNTQKNIEVGVLSEEDSWHLFKKNAGGIVDSHALETVAREVAKECAGLPIALVTLGKALRNKDKFVWEDTALQLRKSDFTYIDGMNAKVFSSIKLSYDYLGNEIIRKCFLLCCLFPEDYRIRIDELMMYVMGDDDILQDLETLKQVRGRLHTVLDKLIGSSLLFFSKVATGSIDRVWMHDIVRDVAISIASKEGKGFYVKAGAGLRNWPERGIGLLSHNSNSKCLRLSLTHSQISVLPEQPELAHLLSLSLRGNQSLKVLPGKFYESMKALVYLNISRTGITSLPPLLSCLLNLHTLDLDYCDFDPSIDISQIGELKRLEILSLRNSNLRRLPKEIGRLTNLKLLDLSRNLQLDNIPPNVISSLSHLEELHMDRSFSAWEVELEGLGNGSNASLAEVASLTCLTGISLLATLSNKADFKISFDDHDHQCDLTGPLPVCHSVELFIQRADQLKLSNFTGLESVEHLIAGVGFLDKLKFLEISSCDIFVSILTFDVVKRVPNLETLDVNGCYNLENVFHVLHDEDVRTANTLPRLREIILSELPILETIWMGVIPLGWLENLEVLTVQMCYKLRYLFTLDMARCLKQLKELNLMLCNEMVEIISSSDEEMMSWVSPIQNTTTCTSTSITSTQVIFPRPEEKEQIVFSQLSKLSLQMMPNLSSFHQAADGSSSLFSWPSLQEIEVDSCEELKRLPLMTQQSAPQLRRILGENEWFQGLEWESPSVMLHLQPLFQPR